MIPCHEASAYILLQTVFIFHCYIICIAGVYFLLSYEYILKENGDEFFRLTLYATSQDALTAELEKDHTAVTGFST